MLVESGLCCQVTYVFWSGVADLGWEKVKLSLESLAMLCMELHCSPARDIRCIIFKMQEGLSGVVVRGGQDLFLL